MGHCKTISTAFSYHKTGDMLQYAFCFVVFLLGVSHAAEANEEILKRLENLEHIVQKQNEVIEDQNTHIDKLQRINDEQDNKIAELENQVRDKQNLPDNTSSDAEHIGLDPEELADGDSQDGNFQNNGLPPKGRIDKRVIVPTNHVAFTAYYDHNPDLHDGDIVVFNRILYNEGNSYNAASGIFACRYSGVYLFALSIGTINENAVAKIVIDGRNQVDSIAEGEQLHSADWLDSQGSTTLITHVNEGENVWVIQYFEDDAHLRGEDQYRFTSFSGVLLYQ